ncbi:MAG: pyridoxal 5'-phosphate synthase glutaminase subunit PdxT, partial [Gammaproteobacteria bacterium]|nr:pyridoxal 5'-phosphate synthase glutaminase subunit PdxT [Gammaproteobacteria bacterium]
MSCVVGVLALQGAFEKHVEMLSSLGVTSQLVRSAIELEQCSALIIPGGESTTMSMLIQKFDLYDNLRRFSEERPVMGVCAGAILMAESVDDSRVTPLNIMPVRAVRNNYGRQIHSFSAELNLSFDINGPAYHGFFIRAPLLEAKDKNIETLVIYNGVPVMLKKGH